MGHTFIVGSGKSVLWFVAPQICGIGKLIVID